MKRCMECREVRPVTLFHYLRSSPDGRGSVCGDCRVRRVAEAGGKVCGMCRERKSVDAFSRSYTQAAGLQHYCKSCMNARKMDWARRNPEQWVLQNAVAAEKYRRPARTFVFEFLRGHPCVDCGEDDVRILEFDHVRGIKVWGVGNMVGMGWPIQQIAEEIAKCEVRCGNCHLVRSWQGSWRHRLWEDPDAELNGTPIQQRVWRFVASHLNQHPCVDCGEPDIRCLDFDHVKSGKTANINHHIRRKSIRKLQAEISLCVVRCRNCHVLRTNEGTWRHLMFSSALP